MLWTAPPLASRCATLRCVRNGGLWHEADVQHLLKLGLFTATLRALGTECQLIGAFQTWR